MQTDILLKQAQTALADLRTAMDKFEKFPNTHYASQLHAALNHANKLVSAYTVLKEQKEVSPELDLHLKIMSAQTQPQTTVPETKPETPVAEPPKAELKKEEPPKEELKPEIKPVVEEKREPVVEEKQEERVTAAVIQPVEEKKPEPVYNPPVQQPVVNTAPKQEIPKLSIGINDKFRLINELFASNANEYGIALEQLNNVGSKEEADTYLKGLKTIYQWDEESEMVRKLYSMNQKRFA